MGSRARVSGGRPHVLATKLSDSENDFVERVRGSLTRAEYARWLVVREMRREGLTPDPRRSGGQIEPYPRVPEQDGFSHDRIIP